MSKTVNSSEFRYSEKNSHRRPYGFIDTQSVAASNVGNIISNPNSKNIIQRMFLEQGMKDIFGENISIVWQGDNIKIETQNHGEFLILGALDNNELRLYRIKQLLKGLEQNISQITSILNISLEDGIKVTHTSGTNDTFTGDYSRLAA